MSPPRRTPGQIHPSSSTIMPFARQPRSSNPTEICVRQQSRSPTQVRSTRPQFGMPTVVTSCVHVIEDECHHCQSTGVPLWRISGGERMFCNSCMMRQCSSRSPPELFRRRLKNRDIRAKIRTLRNIGRKEARRMSKKQSHLPVRRSRSTDIACSRMNAPNVQIPPTAAQSTCTGGLVEGVHRKVVLPCTPEQAIALMKILSSCPRLHTRK